MSNANNCLIFTNHVDFALWSKPHTANFDGREFAMQFGSLIPVYLAKRARGGDKDAADVLTAFKVTVYDADGKVYWPVANEEAK